MMLMAVAAAKATHAVPNVSSIAAAANERAVHDMTARSGVSMDGSARRLFTQADVAALTSLLSALANDGDS